MAELGSMSEAVRKVIDSYQIGHLFYGNELKEDVVRIYPEAVNMYPDTILRMARRHRRDSFCVVDQNNSLYKRTKSLIEIMREKAEEERRKEEERKSLISTEELVQGELFDNYFFLAVLVAFFLGAVLPLDAAAAGRPLIPASLIASKSACVYNPVGPIYLNGNIPFRLNLILTADEETSNNFAISTTVNPSMPISINHRQNINQEQIVKKLQYLNNYEFLHGCIAKFSEFLLCSFFLYYVVYYSKKIFKIFAPTLDRYIGRGYNVYMLLYSNNKTIKPAAKPLGGRLPQGAKGDLYGKERKFRCERKTLNRFRLQGI